MNRRAVLTGSAVALLGTSSGAVAENTDTAIMRLFRKHQALTDAADAYKPDDMTITDEEMNLLFYNERDGIEDEMMTLPCAGVADFAAKMIVATMRGGVSYDWETGDIWAEARALTA